MTYKQFLPHFQCQGSSRKRAKKENWRKDSVSVAKILEEGGYFMHQDLMSLKSINSEFIGVERNLILNIIAFYCS